MARRLTWMLVILLASTACGQTPAPVAEEFRVDTKVFQEGLKSPVATVRTLFLQTPVGEVIYDFVLGESPETTILDVARGRIILISPLRRAASEVPMERVWQFSEAIRERAPRQDAAYFNPQFEVQRSGETLTMKSEALSYVVELQAPKYVSAAGRYQLFADWAARINSMRPNPPSFGREKVNEQIAAAQRVPRHVRRSGTLRGRKMVEVWAEHAYIWALSRSDRELVAKTQEQWANFESLPINSYLETKPGAATQALK